MRNSILKITLGFSFFFTFLLVDVANARSQLENLRALISAVERPSIHDVWDALGRQVPAQNPLGPSGYENNILQAGPQTIAELEGAFPGGTYAALGRDAFFISDVLSAFYLFNGISDDHVRKLHASTATVNALTSSGRLESFLLSNGLNKKVLPFVVIDRTSFGSNSQSTRFYNTILNWATNNGLPPSAAAVVSTNSGLPFSNYLAAQTRTGHNYTPLNAGYASQLVDFGFWTDTYGTSTKTDSKGAEVGIPTKHFTDQVRLNVISILVDLIRIASTSKFNNDVRIAAQGLGFNLENSLSKRAKVSQITKQTGQPNSGRSAEPKTWKDFFDGLSTVNHTSGYFSVNGNALLAQISTVGVPNTLNSEFVTHFFTAHANAKFSSRDLRRIFLNIMGTLNSIQEKNSFLKIVRGNPSLASLLTSKGEVFLTSPRYGKNAEQVYRWLVSQGAVNVHPDCMVHFKS